LVGSASQASSQHTFKHRGLLKPKLLLINQKKQKRLLRQSKTNQQSKPLQKKPMTTSTRSPKIMKMTLRQRKK